MKNDVTIIGGGVVGTAIARELSRYNLSIALVEREADIAFGGATKANTGIIHAGYDDLPGTLKAELCVRGNILWSKIARELNVPFNRVGSLVLALKEEDVRTLLDLKDRGEKNSVPSLEIIEDQEKLLSIEPNVNEKAVAALSAPTAGITSPYEAAIALAENARQNGVQVLLETEVEEIILGREAVKGVQTDKGLIEAKCVINSAGLFSDEVSAMAGINHFSITPIRGEYFIFDKILSGFVKHVLFPVPTPISKGIVVTHTVNGNLLIGPNANSIDDKMDLATTRCGLEEVFEGAIKLVPRLSSKRSMIITNFSGLRAETSTGDFIIEAYDEPRGFVNVAGIKSPGLTSAPAIAERVTNILIDIGFKLREKTSFNPHREPIHRSIDEIYSNSADGKGRLLAKDPKYGHIVCRCEHVSEGEVVEAIKRGATTIEGIKFRTRAGMGRCQGGFCKPRLIRILERELDIKVKDVTERGGLSVILPYEAKSLIKREGGLDSSKRC